MVLLKNKHEQFKKILRALLIVSLVISQTAIFAYAWITEYNNYIVLPFVQKGNWFFYVVYMILLSIFLHSFDGLKYGLYRKTNLVTAQILACLATAFIIYLQIVLLAARFVTVIPLLFMLLGNIAITLLITFLGDYITKKLFPARKTLVVYDNYSPEAFLDKIAIRKDKFLVQNIVNVSVGIEDAAAVRRLSAVTEGCFHQLPNPSDIGTHGCQRIKILLTPSVRQMIVPDVIKMQSVDIICRKFCRNIRHMCPVTGIVRIDMRIVPRVDIMPHAGIRMRGFVCGILQIAYPCMQADAVRVCGANGFTEDISVIAQKKIGMLCPQIRQFSGSSLDQKIYIGNSHLRTA